LSRASQAHSFGEGSPRQTPPLSAGSASGDLRDDRRAIQTAGSNSTE
jgi:hypothetical protein